MDKTFIFYAIAFLIGILANELIHYVLNSYGTLRIDSSNPEKDVYRIELDKIDGLTKKKFIVLKVDNNAHISQ